MKTFLRVIISLAIFIAVFVILFFVSPKYFSIIDSHYYQASVVNSIKEELEETKIAFGLWCASLGEQFRNFVEDDVVRRCMIQSQTDVDIALREKLSAELVLSIPFMKGLRIVEKDTQRIHFSTFSGDIISKTASLISYAKYGKNPKDIPYDTLLNATSEGFPCVDIKDNLLVFSQDFYDDYNVHRGKVWFYVSARSFAQKLINEKRMAMNEELSFITDDSFSFVGILLGLPYDNSDSMKEEVQKEWLRGSASLAQITQGEDSNLPFWLLVSHKSIPYFVGKVCDVKMFTMPLYARYFLISCISLAFFLVSFLLLNLKQDKLLVARKKIRRLHAGIIEDILKDVNVLDEKMLQEKIEYRRHDANAQIKKALGKNFAAKYEKEVASIFEQSWIAIVNVLQSKTKTNVGTSSSKEDEILTLLKEILKHERTAFVPNASLSVEQKDRLSNLVMQHPSNVSENLEKEVIDEIEEVMEAESVDDVMEVEEVEDIELLDVSGGKELDKVSDFEGLDEIEELEEVVDEEEVAKDVVEDIPSILEEVGELETLNDVGIAEPVEFSDLEDLDEEVVQDSIGNVSSISEVEGIEEETGLIEEVAEESSEEILELESLPEDVEELEELEELDEGVEGQTYADVNVGDFIYFDAQPDVPAVRTPVEVDDYIAPDEELLDSQKAEAENKFKDISIGGLDFSYLDEKKDDDAFCVSLLSTENPCFEKPILSFQSLRIMGELEAVGDEEPAELVSLEEEDAIVNKDGVYTINNLQNVKPDDMEFKSLVDSVLRGNMFLF